MQDKNILKQMKCDEFSTVGSETTVYSVERLKTPCAVDYKKNMGAVDRHDQIVCNYAIECKRKRWWVRMFVNVLDAIMVNADIVYWENIQIMNVPSPQFPPKPMSPTNLWLVSFTS